MSTNTPTSDRIEKQVELDVPVDRVWRALTDYREFNAWFKVNLESPFIPGQHSRGNITYPGYEHFVMDVLVERMEEPRLFSFRWNPGAVQPDDVKDEQPTLVEFRLEPTKAGTLLTVTESGFDAIPAARRDEAFRLNDQGWTEQMEMIKAYLADAPA